MPPGTIILRGLVPPFADCGKELVDFAAVHEVRAKVVAAPPARGPRRGSAPLHVTRVAPKIRREKFFRGDGMHEQREGAVHVAGRGTVCGEEGQRRTREGGDGRKEGK